MLMRTGIVLRTMRRRAPFRSLVVALTLAVGIAGAVLAASAFHAVVWKPLPFIDPNRLVVIESQIDGVDLGLTEAEFSRVAGFRELLAGAGALRSEAPALYVAPDTTRALDVALISHSLLPTLGVAPLAGRTFAPSDREGDHFVLLSDSVAEQLFGTATGGLGRSIRLDAIEHTVIGIVPRSLRVLQKADVWKTFDLEEVDGPRALTVIGRLDSAVPGETAERALAEALGLTQPSRALVVNPLRRTTERQAAQMRAIAVTIGAVLAVVLINVVTLQLLRAREHSADSRVRAALGASPRQMMEPYIIESVVLVLGGSLAGIAIAVLCGDWLSAVLQRKAGFEGATLRLPLLQTWLTVAPLTLVAMLGIMSFGSRPGARLAHTGTRALRGAGYQSVLAAVQIAVALAVAIAAVAAARHSFALQRTDPGFVASNRWTGELKMASVAEQGDPEAQARILDEVVARLRALGPVVAAGAISSLPLHGFPYTTQVNVDGASGWLPEQAQVRFTSPGYFEAMRIPVLEGTAGWEGTYDVPVAVISRSLAERLWPGAESVVGRIMAAEITGMPTRVLGVVGDVRHTGLAHPAEPALYLSTKQFGSSGDMMLVVAVRDEPGIAGLMRTALHGIPSPIHLGEIRPLGDIVASSIEEERALATFASSAAIGGLLLAALGIMSVSSQSVSARRAEFAIRMTCGATPTGTVGRVAARTSLIVAAGTMAGIALALATRALVPSPAYQALLADPLVSAMAGAAVVITAGIATLPAAITAGRIAPVELLRHA